SGVYVARCGQRLFMGTCLYDEPPGWMSLLPALDRADRHRRDNRVTPAHPERKEGGVGRPRRCAVPLDYHGRCQLGYRFELRGHGGHG
ncbi:MAG: hypothetical protein ACRDRT_15535, partial [Pseudonocardiaceae bacterium]